MSALPQQLMSLQTVTACKGHGPLLHIPILSLVQMVSSALLPTQNSAVKGILGNKVSVFLNGHIAIQPLGVPPKTLRIIFYLFMCYQIIYLFSGHIISLDHYRKYPPDITHSLNYLGKNLFIC